MTLKIPQRHSHPGDLVVGRGVVAATIGRDHAADRGQSLGGDHVPGPGFPPGLASSRQPQVMARRETHHKLCALTLWPAAKTQAAPGWCGPGYLLITRLAFGRGQGGQSARSVRQPGLRGPAPRMPCADGDDWAVAWRARHWLRESLARDTTKIDDRSQPSKVARLSHHRTSSPSRTSVSGYQVAR